jgi:Uma2 family endonuclease
MTTQELVDLGEKHRLTVEEYLLLDREGAFGDRRTELLDGEVFYVAPKHRPHARLLGDTYYAVRQALEAIDSSYSALVEVSARLSDHDLPIPDIVITDDPDGDGVLPLGALKVAIEVSDSTIRADLGAKAKIYARAGVREYWVIDVKERRVIVQAHPRSGSDDEGYEDLLELPFGEMLFAASIPGLTVDTTGWG